MSAITLCLRPFTSQQFGGQLVAWTQLRKRPDDRQALLDWVELGQRAHDALRDGLPAAASTAPEAVTEPIQCDEMKRDDSSHLVKEMR